jgi:hypothetical protein
MKNDLRATECFPTNYSISIDAELPPGGGHVANFRRGSPTPVTTGADGPLVSIEPQGSTPWLACFAKGYRNAGVLNAVLATPNPEVVCVVSGGAGFWVDTIRRTIEDIRAFPIRQVEVAGGLLIFCDFTKLAAYGAHGVAWVSKNLVSDGLVLEKADADKQVLICRGLDAATASQIQVIVDSKSGQVTGELPD